MIGFEKAVVFVKKSLECRVQKQITVMDRFSILLESKKNSTHLMLSTENC